VGAVRHELSSPAAPEGELTGPLLLLPMSAGAR
jgi:hypothetical protein